MKHRLSIRAESDLQSIWSYTYKNYGMKKAEAYFKEIENSIKVICKNPSIGMSREDVKQGYRSIPVNDHVIFYRMKNNEIIISRVFHQSMDYSRYL